MRNPNGYGSINKLKGNRRNPYWVRTALKTECIDGKIVHKRDTIGYYKTRKEAIEALAEYNKDPYTLNKATFEEIWHKSKVAPGLFSESRLKTLDGKFKNYFSSIAEMNIKDIKTEHLQGVLDDCPYRSGVKQALITIMHTVFNYALANDYILKDYSRYIKYKIDGTVLDRKIFTTAEINTLWNESGDWLADYLLILLYTGCRYNEIASNKAENLDLINKTIFIPRECCKNDNSVRIIPIHEKILPLLEKYKGNEYLFERPDGYKMAYNGVYDRLIAYSEERLENRHTLHDTRHTFTTELKLKHVELYYIDELVGHAHKNITEDIYTHTNVENLRAEINKISFAEIANK